MGIWGQPLRLLRKMLWITSPLLCLLLFRNCAFSDSAGNSWGQKTCLFNNNRSSSSNWIIQHREVVANWSGQLEEWEGSGGQFVHL